MRNTGRLDAFFCNQRAHQRKALCAYIMAFDHDYDSSLQAALKICESGADILEVGFPFSDPMADGEVIQAAARRSIAAGGSLSGAINLVKDFRNQNRDTPVVLMGYLNPVIHMGVEKFSQAAASAGVDGLILVDLPLEEEAEVTPLLERHGLALIRLVAPTTMPERIEKIARIAEGFVYIVSVTGVTGSKVADYSAISRTAAVIRAVRPDLPVLAGFGIKSPMQAKEAAAEVDGVVVGSSIVARLAAEGAGIRGTCEFVAELKAALRFSDSG